MGDLDIKAFIFGVIATFLIILLICIVKEFNKTRSAYGKLERVDQMQKRFNTTGEEKKEGFLDRGSRMISNGFGYLMKDETPASSISEQAQELVNKAATAVASVATNVQEKVANIANENGVSVPEFVANENEVAKDGDVAPTSGNPIESSPTEAFGSLRYTSDFSGLLGQGVKVSSIAQGEANEGKSVSLSQQAMAKKMGFKTM